VGVERLRKIIADDLEDLKRFASTMLGLVGW
jgi:hypothetical protein